MNEAPLICNFVVSTIHDDKIHIIGNKGHSVFHKDLFLSSELQDESKTSCEAYTLGNVCCYKNRIYYFNNSINSLERVNPNSYVRKFQVLDHRVKESWTK